MTPLRLRAIISNRVGIFREVCHAAEEGEDRVRELAEQDKVIGVKQSRKAIREGRARKVYLACDADPALTEPIAQSCAQQGIPVKEEYSMAQLGHACRITVGASVVALLKEAQP